LMVGPDLAGGSLGLDVDLDLAFGARGTTRFGRPIPNRGPGPAYREGSGPPGAPAPGESFRPTRDLSARREAYQEGAPSGTLGRTRDAEAEASPGSPARPSRPIIPGERQFRDGDRVRHGRWGDG